MKKVLKFSSLVLMSAVLTISSPVMAQTTDDGTTTTRAVEDDDDDDGQDWGWIGLAGLLGLLGLRKKDDRHIHVERRSDTPNTNR
jgi:MYXO-CTERM domain-containing protein